MGATDPTKWADALVLMSEHGLLSLAIAVAVVVLLWKIGVFEFVKSAIPFMKRIDEKFDSLHQKVDELSVRIDTNADNIRELSIEQFKKNVYNDKIPLVDRVANYVRYRRFGGNGLTTEYFNTVVKLIDQVTVESVLKLMDWKE